VTCLPVRTSLRQWCNMHERVSTGSCRPSSCDPLQANEALNRLRRLEITGAAVLEWSENP